MDKLDEVVSQIRSCLISTKGQVTVRQLDDDFYTLLGCRIPYRQFEFRSLDEFLKSIPSIYVTRNANGQTMVDAKVTAETEHISSMVRKQKTATKKTKSYRFNSGRAPNRHNYDHGPGPNKWRPKNKPIQPPRRNQRLSSVSHNQFVQTAKPAQPPQARSVPSRVVVVNKQQEQEVCPLVSTKKRLNKLMSTLSVERDSGNSSPTAEYAAGASAASSDAFLQTGDAILDLKNFVNFHKLPEPEVVMQEQRLKKNKLYNCKLQIGQYSYLSYPQEHRSPVEAERGASEKALKELMTKYAIKRKSLLISSDEDIMERIPPMLEKHNCCVWMWQIEEDYVEKFNEQLPLNWMQIVDRSPFVSIETCPGGSVLAYCDPGDVLQKGKRLDISLNVMDVSVPCSTVTFGDKNRIYGLVTAAASSNEIWCQHSGTTESKRFYQMLEEMGKFYPQNKEKHIPTKINFGCCYAAFHGGVWIRVRALGQANDTHIDCFLIDYGEETIIPQSQIYSLRRQFAFIGAQAFVCRLSGLEDLADASIDSKHLQNLIGNEYLIEMISDEVRAAATNGDAEDDVTVPVVMYDLETNRSVNEHLIQVLTLETATPTLDKNFIKEVYVSHIDAQGDVYVQLPTSGYDRLMTMLQNINEMYAKQAPSASLRAELKKSKLFGNEIFLIKFDGKWQRCEIIDWSPKEDMAQIYFIDNGNTAVIKCARDFLIDLNQIDDVLAKYPAQAVKVRFNIRALPVDFEEKAHKLMPSDQLILMKIANFDNENVAWVEFFKRSTDGGLFCINKSIDFETELRDLDCANNNHKRRLMNLVQFNESKNVPSGGSLKTPKLPQKDDYFFVKVPFSVNPWNFFVQPLESLDGLNEMMREMQQEYKNQAATSPLDINNIFPGQIYASQHNDGMWYRTSVLKVIHSGSISVFYCDFGYYTNLKLNQLIPLHSKYMALPYQAIKAKLAGIRPIQNKWTMEDCEYFNSLVMGNKYASIVSRIEKDELYQSDLVLQIHLIDTSGKMDVDIKNLLVEKKIAMMA